jgi:hypothetical protein
VLAAPAAQASVVLEPPPVAEVARRAVDAMVGQVERSRSLFENGLIVTEHRIRVVSCLRGSCGNVVTLRTLGGVVGDLGMHVEGMPRLGRGMKVVLLGQRRGGEFVPLGQILGTLRLVGTVAIRDLSGFHVLKSGAVRPGAVERVPLGDLERLLRGADGSVGSSKKGVSQ